MAQVPGGVFNKFSKIPQNARLLLRAYSEFFHDMEDVTIEDMGMTLTQTLSEESLIEVGKRVLGITNRNTVLGRFCLGDYYNSLPNNYGNRKAWVVEHFGAEYYLLFRQCGYVAAKWSMDKRRLNWRQSWSFFRDSTQVRKTETQTIRRLIIVKREVIPEGELLTCKTATGKQYTVLYIPIEEMPAPCPSQFEEIL